MILAKLFNQAVTEGPGTSEFTDHLLEIVIMLLAAFLLGLWIGRILLKRYKNEVENLKAEINILKAEAMGAEDKSLEIKTLNEKITLLEQKNTQLRTAQRESNQASHNTTALETKIQSQDMLIGRLVKEIEMLQEYRSNFVAAQPIAPVVEAKKEEPKAEEPRPAKKAKPAKKKRVLAPGHDDLTKIEGIGPKIEQLLNEDNIRTYRDMVDGGVDKIQAVLDKAGPLYKVHDPMTWTKQAELAADAKWDELYQMQSQLKGGKKR
jgi:predicted flap endonuclease-1-like 5' DNA nuclease